MIKGKSFTYGLLALSVIVGMTVPAAAVSTIDGVAAVEEHSTSVAATTAQENTTQNDSSVNVTVGQQLSTVIDVSSDEVQTDFENTAFEVSVEGANEEEQAEAIAERADVLRERAGAIREDYEEATEAYEDGEITKSEYAQRLATLNARATNLLNSYDQLQERAQNVSALELRAAGVNQSALRAAVENLSSVSGTGSAALLAQFTGEAEGNIELETADGLSIEIRSDDGEQSREIERPRDDDQNITVSQSTALDTARAALSTPKNGTWTLTETKVNQDEGAYEFAFVLQGAPAQTGEAEVSVDGSSGKVFALEEEIETRDEEDEEDAEDDENETDGELAMVVSEGTPGPNETVTVQVLSNGKAAENVTVFLNEQAVGTTASDGTVTVRLPESGEAELTAQKGDAEGELEFEFEEEDEENEVFRNLNVDTSLTDDTVTVSVTYDGSGVANATVYANGQAVGTTSSDGMVTFTIDTNATEELELEVVKGAFEGELAYLVQDGSLTLTEEAHESDGDKAEAEDESEEESEESEEESEESEEKTEEESEEETETTEEESEEESDEESEEATVTPEETKTPEEETEEDES